MKATASPSSKSSLSRLLLPPVVLPNKNTSNNNHSSRSNCNGTPINNHKKRPLPITSPIISSSMNYNSSNSNHSLRLRSPKGSCSPHHTTKQRSHPSTLLSLWSWSSSSSSSLERLWFYHIYPSIKALSSTYFCYVILLSIMFSVAYITTQNILTVNVSSPNTYDFFTTSTTSLSSSSSSSQQQFPARQHLNSQLSLFDSTLYPVLPKSIYIPKSSNPISVIYIGRRRQNVSTKVQSSSVSKQDYDNDDIILDALQRSSYTKVITSYMYSSNNMTHPIHLLYKQQYHHHDSYNNNNNPSKNSPMVYIVDWSALERDCHLLQRILSYIIMMNSNLNNNNNNNDRISTTTTAATTTDTYMLLLDASPSSQTIMCSMKFASQQQQQQQLMNYNLHIRLAKRSIIAQRRYNYTKQWIESGTLILNPPPPPPLLTTENDIHNNENTNNDHNYYILHWSGYVSQSYVQLLNLVLHDFQKHDQKKNRRRRQKETRYNQHERPIDVAHYWKAVTTTSTAKKLLQNEYYYYYNRLRQTVQQQLNTTHIVMLQQQQQQQLSTNGFKKDENKDDKEITRWLEFVGIDTNIEFTKTTHSSTKNDDGKNTNNDDNSSNEEDGEEDEEQQQDNDNIDDATIQASIHVAVLASSKIVVVTQDDEYEDYDTRLLEALASGAMVLCDTMIAPPFGLIHKTNIVFFDSITKLDHYIQYYLNPINELQRQEIARHGIEYALGRHRSYHTIEALLFGKALTRTDKDPLIDDGPPQRKSTLKLSTHPDVIKL